jgi:hypothetical protein
VDEVVQLVDEYENVHYGLPPRDIRSPVLRRAFDITSLDCFFSS